MPGGQENGSTIRSGPLHDPFMNPSASRPVRMDGSEIAHTASVGTVVRHE